MTIVKIAEKIVTMMVNRNTEKRRIKKKRNGQV